MPGTAKLARLHALEDGGGPPDRRRGLSAVPYLPGLDGMRAFAVIAVVIYHANSEWLKGGFLGVEMFFVISGYLITLLLIAEQERTGKIGLGQFWLRRARRLLPALFLMMLLITTYVAFFKADELGKLRGDVIAGTFYVSNWFQIWAGAGYAAAGEFAPLRHLWSLAVEEQFYLLWPLVMVALMRNGTRNLTNVAKWLFAVSIGVTVLVAILSISGPVGTPETNPNAYWTIAGRSVSKADALYLGTLSRASGLLLGAAFAMIWRPKAIMRGPLRYKARALDGIGIIGLAGMAVLMWTVGFIGGEGVDPFLFRGGFFFAGVATLMAVASVTHRDSMVARALSVAPVLWVGTRSYGIYLYHWPIYQIIRETAGTHLKVWEFAMAMVITGIITELSYRYVETPIRKGVFGRNFRRATRSADSGERRFVLVGAAVGVALAVFAGTSLATAELKQSELETILNEGAQHTCDPVKDPSCGQADPPDSTADTGSTVTQPQTGGSTVPGETATPESTTSTTVTPAPIDRLGIGDSVMLGAAGSLTDYGFVVDAAESRQFNQGVQQAQALRDQGRLGQIVVVHLGTNGVITQEGMDAMMEALSAVPQVLLVTVDVDREWTAGNNALIYDTAAAYDNVELLDWAGLDDSCPGDCFAADGFHMNAAGADYYAGLIATALGIA